MAGSIDLSLADAKGTAELLKQTETQLMGISVMSASLRNACMLKRRS